MCINHNRLNKEEELELLKMILSDEEVKQLLKEIEEEKKQL